MTDSGFQPGLSDIRASFDQHLLSIPIPRLLWGLMLMKFWLITSCPQILTSGGLQSLAWMSYRVSKSLEIWSMADVGSLSHSISICGLLFSPYTMHTHLTNTGLRFGLWGLHPTSSGTGVICSLCVNQEPLASDPCHCSSVCIPGPLLLPDGSLSLLHPPTVG